MFGLIKAKKIQAKAQEVIAQTTRVLDDLIQSGESADAMLQRLGVSRAQALEAILADDEVESCREDLRAAMLSRAWRVWGEGLSEEDNDLIWRTVQRHLPTLAEVTLTAKLNGYGVAMYVWEKDETGLFSIANVINRQGSIGDFAIKADGLLYEKDMLVNSQVLYLALVNRPTDTRPAGEMSAARLYPAVALRRQGFLYAAQFITRYAQPYLLAKTDSQTDEEHRSFVSRLFGFMSGGAMSVGREDDVQLLQNSANGEAFRSLENLANARIQKLLLGKVRTADLATGSRAAQETEEKARGERIDGYLYLLGNAVQHMIDAILLANLAWGRTINAPKGVWFEWHSEAQVDKNRAERDQIYLNTGAIKFTPEYYRDIVGYAENHFELVDSGAKEQERRAPNGKQQLSGSLKLSDSSNGAPLIRADNSVENLIMQPKMQAVLSALDECESFEEWQARLAALDLSAGDSLLIQRLVGDGVTAWLEGEGETWS